jgi:hypothetical protein
MTQAPPAITESYPPEALDNHDLLLEILATAIRLESELARLKAAWAAGGLKGLRRAASE